ncbi:aldehyde dehydrogenase family 3 member A2-like [Corticium candelabrum]|uniref:aldehyde dehydrogenase family 3 member A2-like n=1 Tax=Corticium candelabrum TaxID=121492 RepID=UPI002E26B49C|nr:aldehyde dehydrogenase family 3 member A2-like [Corticium candelabrum]
MSIEVTPELQQQAEQVVARARQTFRSGRTKAISFRKTQLRALYRFMTEQEAAIKQALYDDLHKSDAEAQLMELDTVMSDIADHVENLDKWTKPQPTQKGMAFLLDKTEIVYEPYGVVLIIGAWNYPFQLTLWPLLGAIAAGNCAVLKPSEVAGHTSELLEKELPQYLDKDCFHVVAGDARITTALLQQRFDYIFYTGSSQVGKVVLQAAAKHITPVTLELGGKGPCIVDSDCDITVVARRILFGKFLNAGQTCIAPDYVLCDHETQDKLVEAMRAPLVEFYGKNPKESQHFGRIVNKRHFERVKKLLDSNKVVIGGETDEETLYIAPTILANVSPDDDIMKEENEVFGPLLPIVPVAGKEEAIEFVNSREKPLAMYAFSNNKQFGQDLIDQTSSGQFCFNDTLIHAAVPSLPFGGVGHSGMGAYHGKFTFETFSHKRAVMLRTMKDEWLQGKLRYPPLTPKKVAWMQRFLKKNLRDEKRSWWSMLLVLLIGAGMAFFVMTCLHM